MRTQVLMLAAIGALAACGQKPDSEASANATTSTAASSPHPTFCFFKDEETKGWAAKRAANGDLTVSGTAHVKDSRYQATLGAPEISGTTASLWLSINPNSGAFGAIDDWWDVTTTLPGSGAVTGVKVMCGPKALAELTVAPAGAR